MQKTFLVMCSKLGSLQHFNDYVSLPVLGHVFPQGPRKNPVGQQFSPAGDLDPREHLATLLGPERSWGPVGWARAAVARRQSGQPAAGVGGLEPALRPAPAQGAARTRENWGF